MPRSGRRTSTNRAPRKPAAGLRTSCSRSCPTQTWPPPRSPWRAPRPGCGGPRCPAPAGRSARATRPERRRCTGSCAMALSSQSPVSDDRGPLVIRPSWAALGRWEMHVAPFLVIAVVFGTLKIYARHPYVGSIMLVAGVLGIVAGCYAVYMAGYMLGTSITVTSDQILVTHWFRSTATVSLREVSRVVRCSVSYRDEEGKPAVFAFSSAGRCVMSLYAFRWDQADLDRVWHFAGRTPEGSWTDEVRYADLKKRFPGAF